MTLLHEVQAGEIDGSSDVEVPYSRSDVMSGIAANQVIHGDKALHFMAFEEGPTSN